MDTKRYSIYKITNPTGKVYIGQTCNPKKRLQSYKRCKPDQNAIYNSLQKYGYEAHSFQVIFKDLTKVEVDIFEIELIEFYKSEGISLNIARGGSSNTVPTKFIPVVRFTLSGEYIDEFESITAAAKYIRTSPTSIRDALPSNRAKRKCYTSKGYLWLLQSDYENGIKPELKPLSKPRKGSIVYQYDLEGNFIAEHLSIRAAARSINADIRMITNNIAGITKRAREFIFSYEKGVQKYVNPRKGKKTVYCFDLKGNLISSFENVKEAAKALNLHYQTIIRRVNDKNQLKNRLYCKYLFSYDSIIIV